MTGHDLVEELPLSRRLALAYAPASSRESVLALLALDARLAGIVRSSTEPMLAQLRLAWWREQLAADGAAWPQGEPILIALRSWGGRHGGLVPLVDGWEAMTGDAPIQANVFEGLAQARAEGFALLAGDAAAPAALRLGRNWALADLAGHLGHPQERATALSLARQQDWHGARLPRALRPLAVLHGLAARALRRDGNTDRIGPMDLLAAMRIGLLGF